ncbi:MAG: right-handed parallel beta-helix repeat-containing protein [Thermodesulfobacteriota bacterium]|nr:right-handed parallel beta-helix repeat-containing protein [Thermodesulfobacteriota bacterium]
MQHKGGRLLRRFRLTVFVVFGNLAIMLMVWPPVFAATIYVDAGTGDGGDGTSWEAAFNSLEDGLNAAVSDDQIWVAAGVYIPEKRKCADNARGKAFQLKNGVEVYGGFNGDETTLDGRDWELNQTVLSGELGDDPDTVDADGNNCYHVFYHPPALGLDNTAVLDGFVIQDGVALFEPDDWDFPENAYGTDDFHKLVGAGIYNEQAVPTIRNCTFTAGKAFGGGGICNFSASPVIQNCNFTENLTMFGGGICNLESSAPVIEACIFSDNIANGSVADTTGRGGCIYNESSAPTVTDCEFNNNAAVYGGGIYEMDSTSTLSACDFTDNLAIYGGGMCNVASSSPTVMDCIFKENVAMGSFNDGTGCGGGVYSESASPLYTDCIFMRNIAVAGGAMANWESSATVARECRFLGDGAVVGGGTITFNATAVFINSVFTGNQAELGGGQYNEQSTLSLINCTIAGNEAHAGDQMAETGLGGGLLNVNADVDITNCILWENQADTDGAEIHNEYANTIVSNSNIHNGFFGGVWDSGLGSHNGNNIASDPLFVNESDAGRDQMWGTVDDVYGNFSLQEKSPCINAGATSGTYIPDIDIAGSSRDSMIDIGAYEYIGANGKSAVQAGGFASPLDGGGGGCFIQSIKSGPLGHISGKWHCR